MKKLLLIVYLLASFSDSLLAQNLAPMGDFRVNVDYARFRHNDQSGYLEVYYGLYPFLLSFNWSEGKYHAGVHLITRLMDRSSRAYIVREQALLAIAITDTSAADYKYPFVSQSGYAIPFGQYRLEVVAIDSLRPSRRDSVGMDIVIEAYPGRVACSDLQLCSSIKSSRQQNHPFFKNSLEVVANPTLVFGVTAHPIIYDYVELYNLNPEATYTVRTFIINAQEKVVRESSKQKRYQLGNTVEVGTTPITSMVSGKYRFRIAIFDQESHELSRAEKAFYIYNPHIETATETATAFQPGELDGLSKKELEKEFDQAKYIATEEDIKLFKQLSTEAGEREFLVNFWTMMERGRPGQAAIKRSEYLRQVEIASEQYREMGKEGWRTHRGRIFILYGQPDEVDRFPSTGESKPYEIWRYHKIEGGVEFVFVDRLGYGYYEQVHSTKRGEFRDDNWQRFLR